jgi:adenylate cyclase class IV
MTDQDLRFKEVEHKFVVDAAFDLARFRSALDALTPTRTSQVHVRDQYFLTDGGRSGRYVLRHRFDDELHHLTLKTLEADSQVRVEVNLDLGHHAGDQRAQVDAFVSALGVAWRGSVRKTVDVWYFPDCEVVHYIAATDSRSIRCVEFEAKGRDSLRQALETLGRYESATGFDASTRTRTSLLELLFPDVGALLMPSPHLTSPRAGPQD